MQRLNNHLKKYTYAERNNELLGIEQILKFGISLNAVTLYIAFCVLVFIPVNTKHLGL